jgi:hypothetical protein
VRNLVIGLFCILSLSAFCIASDSIPGANAEPAYQQLRSIGLGNESITVNDLELKREGGTFHFRSGKICFLNPVEGKVTGAVFQGDGTFSIEPPAAGERKSLSFLTKSTEAVEEYNELALRFTDETYKELKIAKGATAAQGGCDSGPLDNLTRATRSKFGLLYNISGRILQDILSPAPGGFFMADIKGKRYSGKMVFVVDKHGVNMGFSLAPEEVALFTYDEGKWGFWAAYHLLDEYKKGTASSAEQNQWFQIDSQNLDVQFEKSGKLAGQATTTFVSQTDGLRVAGFALYRTLQVSSVKDTSGATLNFIQEDKDSDADFFVVLPKALNKGEKFTIVTNYSGKEAIQNEGDGNYYVSNGARTSWYPNTSFDDYATFQMKFTFPKQFKLVATGEQVSEKTEKDVTVAEWRSNGPITVAGFQFGKFKRDTKQLKSPENFTVEVFANTEPPDFIKAVQSGDSIPSKVGSGGMRGTGILAGNWDSTGMMRKAMAEAEIGIQLYTDFFGPTQFKRLAISQQTAMDYGQSWPGLVWLPLSYFYDSTIRHQIGFDDPKGYFKTVGPHEIAHQWFGHTVTWGSYRDQWMSEGFSEFAASVFVQATHPPKDYLDFWKDRLNQLTEKNREGYRAIDVGPVTMGYRLDSSRTGNVTQRLIYPKGGYILHMVRMMMWTPNNGDQNFKAAMHEFVQAHTNKPATTEDFKATLERHLDPDLDITGDRKLDWFFDEYVYGTALPNYHMDYSLDSNGSGGSLLKIKITQSNVDAKFKMLVPVYMEFGNGRISRLGALPMTGNSTREEQVDLSGMKERPKRILLNHYNDVLCTMN